ncbi:response regulator transcription factor [Enterococcus sp. HY326]|uniref:response regulator transcription factor n=1 Tax=Enterococcus sp. HY326 TaxID=2971265 RepID=UPI00223E9F92|nr:response regulator transcription factor [Enterococcus sp. HY326]
MRNEKILIVDDDPAIRRLIWKSLQSTGILVYQSDSVEATIDIVSRIKFDLFILDVGLEHENDGYHLAQVIREADPFVPIVFLSGKTNEEDIVTALENGADFYLTKPFLPNILKAQVLATLERRKIIKNQEQKVTNEIIQGPFRFDKARYELFKGAEPIKMSSKEIKLMQFFMENPDQVFSKEQIYHNVWEDGKYDANTIMVFINHLRNKIEDNPKEAKFLRTVWGIGYTFNPAD